MENIVSLNRDGMTASAVRSAKERIRVSSNSVQDPYRFTVGDIAVRVSFAETDRTLSDCLLNAVITS